MDSATVRLAGLRKVNIPVRDAGTTLLHDDHVVETLGHDKPRGRASARTPGASLRALLDDYERKRLARPRHCRSQVTLSQRIACAGYLERGFKHL